MLASVLANVNRDPKACPKPYTPEDFMPRRESERAQTPEEQLAIVKLWNAALGGEVIEA